MKEIKDDLNRSIFIADRVSTLAQHNQLYGFIRRSLYNIGFEDTDAIERNQHKYLNSDYNHDDFVNSGFKNILEQTEFYDRIKDHNFRLTINLSTPSDVYFSHTHKNQWSILYYANLDWRPEWGGETLFYNDDQSEIFYASVYTPQRLIFFDGEIPHTIRQQTYVAPHYRFTVAMFIDK
jgi:Rps23 Pro-64 3,4-dihydroxylase Tpa1-like proline 4-hydroxylase